MNSRMLTFDLVSHKIATSFLSGVRISELFSRRVDSPRRDDGRGGREDRGVRRRSL